MREKTSLEPCVICDKPDCSATVIVSKVNPETKHFNRANDTLDLVCPACERPFSVSILTIEWFEVATDELEYAFFRAKRAHRRT